MTKYKELDLPGIKNLAREFASEFKNRGAVIGFIGPLGSGKTTFIKSFAARFGIKKITSPTFVVSHEYPVKQGGLYHLDFYRLKSRKELLPLGLSDMIKNKNLVLIEWVDRFPQLAPLCDILITLKVKPDNKRDAEIKYKK